MSEGTDSARAENEIKELQAILPDIHAMVRYCT